MNQNNKPKAKVCNWNIVLNYDMKFKYDVEVSLCFSTQCSLCLQNLHFHKVFKSYTSGKCINSIIYMQLANIPKNWGCNLQGQPPKNEKLAMVTNKFSQRVSINFIKCVNFWSCWIWQRNCRDDCIHINPNTITLHIPSVMPTNCQILFINRRNFLCEKVYIMIYSKAHWDTWDILVSKGKMLY